MEQPMEQSVDRRLYLSLIDRFLAGELSIGPFRAAVFDLLARDKAQRRALVRSWPQPYLEQLHQSRLERRTGRAEYERRRAELLGYADDPALERLVIDLEGACRFCSPDPAAYGEGAVVPDRLEAEAELRGWVRGLRGTYAVAHAPAARPCGSEQGAGADTRPKPPEVTESPLSARNVRPLCPADGGGPAPFD